MSKSEIRNPKSETNPNDQNSNVQNRNFELKIVGFLCNWCSYAGADLAGQSRLEYPPNIKIIRVPCSGRVNPLFVLKCLTSGIDGVLISGCHTGDCHYSEGNFYARRRFAILRKLLEYLGIDPKRFQMAWVSASESDKWARLVKGLVEEIKQAGPNKLGSLSHCEESRRNVGTTKQSQKNRLLRFARNDFE